jgi:hypothetical protein
MGRGLGVPSPLWGEGQGEGSRGLGGMCVWQPLTGLPATLSPEGRGF